MKNKKALVTAGCILAGLIVVYLGFTIFFQSHFCFGTTIDGVSVGGKTPEQVE